MGTARLVSFMNLRNDGNINNNITDNANEEKDESCFCFVAFGSIIREIVPSR